MSDKFREQDGAATMDPGPLRRWLTSRMVTALVREARLDRAQQRAERKRKRAGLPHRLEYFHQVDDPYSHLAAQALRPVLQRYGLELAPHLVRGPSGANLPDPQRLPALARYDAALVAPHYGLRYLAGSAAPAPEQVKLAQRILSAVTAQQFPEAAVAVGEALAAGDAGALEALAGQYGQVDEAQTGRALDDGSARRARLKHYLGAMFYYGGQWYWGVDRLYHLERRWRALGLGGTGGLLFPRPAIDAGSYTANGSLTLEFYVSARSPYSAVIFDRTIELAGRTGVRLALRPVLPMVMRGGPITREKSLYMFADAAREARAQGVDFGRFYDPVGEPVRRCYALLGWAREQGRGTALLGAFLRAAFREGINTHRERGMRAVVERVGLNWAAAQQVMDNEDWHAELEANRQAMYAFGAWGVPTFRLLDSEGEPVVWAWGQDRLWLIAREIQRLLVQA